MNKISFVLVEPDQRSEILFSFARYQVGSSTILFSGPPQQLFFQDFTLGLNQRAIHFSTFQEYLAKDSSESKSVILMDVPKTFEEASDIFQKAKNLGQTVLLVLLKENKKYTQILKKKLNISPLPLTFSPNKLIGINDKLRESVEKSYDLNRAAFYAYGSFLEYFDNNPLKKIFRTQMLDVQKLALSFGFTAPPRVKNGKFLTPTAQQTHRKKKKRQAMSIQATQRLPQNEEGKEMRIKKMGKKIKKVAVAERK